MPVALLEMYAKQRACAVLTYEWKKILSSNVQMKNISKKLKCCLLLNYIEHKIDINFALMTTFSIRYNGSFEGHVLNL